VVPAVVPPFAGTTKCTRGQADQTAANSRSENQSHPQAAFPDCPATLPGGAVKQFKTRREICVLLQLNACASGGIVDQQAFNDRSLWSDEDFGNACDSALRPNALKPSLLVHDRLIRGSAMCFSLECFLATDSKYYKFVKIGRTSGDQDDGLIPDLGPSPRTTTSLVHGSPTFIRFSHKNILFFNFTSQSDVSSMS